MATAVLIDGGFFRKRYPFVYGNGQLDSPKKVADTLFGMALDHVKKYDESKNGLYRIFYYDCAPCQSKVFHPLTQKTVDLGKSDIAKFMGVFLKELKSKRKMAIRLGELRERSMWLVKPPKLKDLLAKRITVNDLAPYDITPDVVQKGVDMKLGLDISWLALKNLVNRIILVSGDSDFVPAAKLARREGIDFILDPMWNNINPDLHEHVDGINSVCPRPKPITKSMPVKPTVAPAKIPQVLS